MKKIERILSILNQPHHHKLGELSGHIVYKNDQIEKVKELLEELKEDDEESED